MEEKMAEKREKKGNEGKEANVHVFFRMIIFIATHQTTAAAAN